MMPRTTVTSDCCAAPVISTNICSDCRMWCEPIIIEESDLFDAFAKAFAPKPNYSIQVP